MFKLTYYENGEYGVAEILNRPLKEIVLGLGEGFNNGELLTEQDILKPGETENIKKKIITRRTMFESVDWNFAKIGDIRFHSREEHFLMRGWTLCNNRKFLVDSKVGRRLLSLPEQYRSDNGINVTTRGTVNLPNITEGELITGGKNYFKGGKAEDNGTEISAFKMYPCIYLGDDLCAEDFEISNVYFGFTEDASAIGWSDGIWYRANNRVNTNPAPFGFFGDDEAWGFDVGIW